MTDSASTDRSEIAARSSTKLDIIGCGAVVQEIHVPLLRLLRDRSEVEIIGCYDRDPVRARRTAPMVGAQRCGTQSMPDEGDGVEAALVATPPGAHAEIAHDYVRSGKNVLVEKPFTATASEARSLVDESRARGVRIAVDHSWRFYPSVNIARRFLQGRLDQISSIEAAEGYRWTWAPASQYVFDDPYGGVIHDTGSHLLDMVLYLLGLDAPASEASIELDAVSKIPAREPSHECEGRLTLSMPEKEGIEVQMTISRLRPVPRGVKVRGSFGVLFVPATFAFAPILFDGADGFRLRGAQPEVEPGDEFGCLLMVHLDFLKSIRGDSLGSRTDAARFVRLSGVLEALHRGAAR